MCLVSLHNKKKHFFFCYKNLNEIFHLHFSVINNKKVIFQISIVLIRFFFVSIQQHNKKKYYHPFFDFTPFSISFYCFIVTKKFPDNREDLKLMASFCRARMQLMQKKEVESWVHMLLQIFVLFHILCLSNRIYENILFSLQGNKSYHVWNGNLCRFFFFYLRLFVVIVIDMMCI